MENIKITLAKKRDRKKLSEFFKHYRVSSLIKNRTDCFLTHNFTVVAKDKEKIVGVIQWSVKEDPKAGVAEFEELYVLEDYRELGIGSLLLEFAIQSVKKYFLKIRVKPRKIHLFVSESNMKARALYEKLGFKNVASVGTLFADKETELFYCLAFE
ncbi:MAG: GNAT family N-acetyltransferase [Candidatus Rickettsiella isopodorum]|nr:GNAT family N-acetyltransferase [Candidatus Rickettsiella isopodorum]